MSGSKVGQQSFPGGIDDKLLRAVEGFQELYGFLMVADIVAEMGVGADQQAHVLPDAFTGDPVAGILAAGTDAEGAGIDLDQLAILTTGIDHGRDVYGIGRVSAVPETVNKGIFDDSQKTGCVFPDISGCDALAVIGGDDEIQPLQSLYIQVDGPGKIHDVYLGSFKQTDALNRIRESGQAEKMMRGGSVRHTGTVICGSQGIKAGLTGCLDIFI